MEITYRPAKPKDLAEAERVVQQAGSALRVRHGRQPWPAPPPTDFPKFCPAQDPSGLWVAEDGDTIIGFGFSCMAEKFWCLSQLFVRPETQATGIGQALLAKTLIQAERNGAANRALITPAYNIASTGLYLRNGLYPREPLYRMAAPARLLHRTLPKPVTASHQLRFGWRLANGLLANGLAGSIRSCSGSAEICTTNFCSAASQRAVRIEHSGRAAGYAYISAEGHVGPLAIAPDADAPAVVTTALRCVLERSVTQVSMLVPGRADVVMRTVLALGFRIEEPYVLMAWRPFGNWCNYLPRTPGFL